MGEVLEAVEILVVDKTVTLKLRGNLWLGEK